MGEEKQKNLKWFLITTGAMLLVLLAGAAAVVHRQDLYCLYLYARCKTTERDDYWYKRSVVTELAKVKSVRLLCWMLDEDDALVFNGLAIGIRRVAAETLGNLGDKRALEPLKKALEAESDKDAREAIQEAIEKLEKIKTEAKK